MFKHIILCLFMLLFTACSNSGSDAVSADRDVDSPTADSQQTSDGSSGSDGTTGSDSSAAPGLFPNPNDTNWPKANAWSWDGSWTPGSGDFPLAGLFDDEYFDAHPGSDGKPTPILPPGEWDWDNSNNDLANWRNYSSNIGTFEPLKDAEGRQFGWRLISAKPGSIDYSGPASYFEGSSGSDILILGSSGTIHSFVGNLGDGPDILVFDGAWSLDFRTGSTESGHARDNDLVIAGCQKDSGVGYQFRTATIHTGPGSDWIFALDMERAGIDAGNGKNGRTDSIDPNDGDDLLVLAGNIKDVRVFGGLGNDTLIWYLDELGESIAFKGANFFGGGGAGDALWGDPGVDRLVLVIPTETQLVQQGPTPEGGLLVMKPKDDSVDWDAPTIDDPFAKYCVTCPLGPKGERTVIMEYRSKNGKSFTGWFYVTAFEELQVGVGVNAKVYRIDAVNGKLLADDKLKPTNPPQWPTNYCKP